MARQTSILFLAIALALFHYVYAFKILAIISLPLKSHYMAFQSLFRELAIRGHSVTVINNFPDKNAQSNLKFIDMKSDIFSGNNTPSLKFYESVDYSFLHVYNFYRHFGTSAVKKDCDYLLNNELVKAHLAADHKYDVVFVEQFMSDCGLAYASVMYDAPIIGITSHVLLPSSYPKLGIPFNFASDSFYFSKSGPNPSLLYKIEAYIANICFNILNKYFLNRCIKEEFDKYLPNNSLDMEHVAKDKMKMIFSYQHFSLTGARVLTPQLLEIGGIHIGNTKALPNDIEQFISNSRHGVIYVSFGSILVASSMSQDKLNKFLEAFSRIPQKVIWKWENATVPQGNSNVLFRSWLPQLDILCHPNVKAFISHGGMLSMSEAVHCGKPVLAVPFFGDQFSNAAMVTDAGLGITMGFQRINSDNLEEAIKDLLSDEKQRTAKRVSKLWHDRPQPVMDSAIYWTEYVARNKMSPPSLPGKHTSWFESTLLDVYCVLIGVLFALIAWLNITFKLCKIFMLYFVRKLVCKRKVKKQ